MMVQLLREPAAINIGDRSEGWGISSHHAATTKKSKTIDLKMCINCFTHFACGHTSRMTWAAFKAHNCPRAHGDLSQRNTSNLECDSCRVSASQESFTAESSSPGENKRRFESQFDDEWVDVDFENFPFHGTGGGRKPKQSQPDFLGEAVSDSSDHYDTLGVLYTADKATIKRAYYQLMLLYHPDKTEGLAESVRAERKIQYQKVQNAYESLMGGGHKWVPEQ